MRRRWKEQYGKKQMGLDDSPSDRPVSLAEEAELDDVAFEHELERELYGKADFHEDAAADLASGLRDAGIPATSAKASAPFPPFMQHMDTSGVMFVDKSRVQSAEQPARFERVAAAAPPSIVSEAVRLTDKRPLLFPWEKGRLGRIFGDQGRLALKKPKLHAGANNFVEIGVSVDSGFSMGASVVV